MQRRDFTQLTESDRRIIGVREAGWSYQWIARHLGRSDQTGRIRNHGHYVCSTWGNYHFKTFDGGFYRFPGNCTYNLASHCQDSYQEFYVHVHRSLDNGHPLIDKITITIKDVTVQLKNNLVVLNGAVVKTPYYGFGILIHKSDDYFKMYTKAGLTLMWNGEDAVMLELDPKFNNHTCGLCGDYNGDPRHREFILEDKTLSPIDFGNQQNVNDPNEVCKDTEETEVINPARCSKYRSACEEHLNQAALSDCIQFLDPEPYIQACMIDMCSCDQSQDSFCLCSSITEYSRQCSHAGGRPGNWRTENFCPKQCPANMIYQESASPCKNSCSHLELNSLCEEHYMDGCFCPEGTVEDNYSGRGCVPVNECFCKHQGKLYAPGEIIKNDCDKCHCVAGRWNCTDLHCPKVCSIEGGVHFTTFDGKTYTFHGNCYYVMLKARLPNAALLNELVPCSSSERETCLQAVLLITDDLRTDVIFKADGTILVNDLKVSPPHIAANFSILQPSKYYIIVETANGIQMQIQLLPKMQLYITMEKPSRKQLQGLCGNFNTKEGDDFTTSAGLVEATASAFANTWKALPTCHDISDWLEDPCSISIENKNYADYWCSKLEKDESPFAKCHSVIDPTEYAKRCRYDSCTCKDSEHCMCAALSSYVRACAAKGIILWGWKNGICDKDITSCPSSQIYLYNLTTCQLTCRSLAEREKACPSVFTSVDGCGCPDGQYLNEKDQCVSISKCSCFYRDTYLKPRETINAKNKQCICHNGNLVCTEQVNKSKKEYDQCFELTYTFQTECTSGCVCPNGLLDDGAGGCVPEDECPCVHNEDIYPHGSQIKADCNTCLCQRGRWTCTKTDCHGTCTIYGNGHYISFDNKIYEFDGNCEFVAAQDYCETNSSDGSFRVLTENIPCGTTGVTCSKSVKVFLGNTLLTLTEKHIVKTVAEGGEPVDYITREVGIFLVIEASNGILLIWDKRTTIFIKVPPAYKRKLCGLCGNFDDNSQNDFRTRHMIQVIDVLEFGNSWKVDATCPDATNVTHPCSQNPHRHSWAEKRCALIKSQVFKICHSKVDPKPFYEACVEDACSCDSGGDCECFCSAVAVYAQECTKAKACVHWRTPDICPIFCDYYNPKGECQWHYHPCGNDRVQTCRSINNIYTNVTVTYLEGCYPSCPKNKPIFDEANQKCVTKEECGCYINDIHYKSGAEVPQYMKCHKCVCSSNGNIECENLDRRATTKKTTITSPTSEADTVPGPTQSSTTADTFTPLIPSPSTTEITILPTPPPPTNTSTIPPKTSTTSLPPTASSASTVVYTQKQVITTEGSLTSISTPKTASKSTSKSALTSATTTSTTKSIITATTILLTTNETSSTTEAHKAISIASTTTTNVDGTTMASLTFSTTSKGTNKPTKSTPITTEATGATNTFPYTTGEVTILNNSTKTTATSSTASSMATSNVRTISTPTELKQTSNISPTITTSTSNPYPNTLPVVPTAIATATSSSTNPTKPITYQSTKTMPTSTTKSTSRLTTQATSTSSSQATTSGSMSHMPSTILIQSTTESTIKSTIPRLIDSTTSSITTTSSLRTTMPQTSTVHTISETSPTTRSVITSSPVPTTVKETSFSSAAVCVCVYKGTTFSPGEIMTVSEDIWCHQVICSMQCKLKVNKWLCSTSVPALPSTPDTSPTSPRMTSTAYSTAPSRGSVIYDVTSKIDGCSFEPFRKVNETWMLNNCTQARCLENHTVEITELRCEPPPNITCANEGKPIAVLHDDQCCWHWECDCVCLVWGDPHYKTFDGTYYTFQGNCTYTLVEEIEKKNNFRIDIDNYDCGAKDGVSCPRNISVLHNTQEIKFVVHGFDIIKVQVAVNGEIIGTPYKRNGVTVYILGVYYIVEIPELGAYIQYNGMNLKIKLPYQRFGHNTQGQCGTCTNNRSDDCRTRNGNIVPRCELMADSWIIEDLKKPECVNNTIPGTPPPSPTCRSTSICSLVNGPIFQKCHNVVSPNDFYKACEYDSCHVPRSGIECSSLQHYAQLCGEKGICIDWRSQIPECSMPCPSHKVYNACGSAIPRTCETIQEEHLKKKDDEHLVEGCFCPQGTVRFSQAVDICVQTCGCVGPDNVPRKFGEKFQLGCEDCICIDGGSGITCQRHKCKEKSGVQ
ncbi:mucin-2-like, partial [Eleutherodactylus coqui]|uniref:mucin-2-like n=1 Tax=Eleutherodactylus coqui TaxID=57060 RepID=UPI0034631121